MAKTKKTKNEEVAETTKLEPIGDLQIQQPEKLKDCEWVFQFDDDTAQIFAWTNENDSDEEPTVAFTIANNKDAYISFTNKESGKRFKLYARELSEEGKMLREYQTKSVEDLKADMETFEKNKQNENTDKEA